MKSALFTLSASLLILATSNSHAASQEKTTDVNQVIKKLKTIGKADCKDDDKDKKDAKDATSTDFTNAQTVKTAFNYYNKPYSLAPEEYTTQGELKVYRPNHGIAHGVRSAALCADLADILIASSTGGEMQTWLKAKIKADPLFMKKMSVMGMLHRSGRQDETDSMSGHPEKREQEMKGSTDNFKEAAAKSGIVFTADDVENFSKAISLDGKNSSNPDQDHLSRLLRAAHIVELIRINLDLRTQIHGLVPELTDEQIKKLYQNEAEYLKVTGDQRNAGSNFTPAFYQLSTNPEALYDAMLKARKANAK